VKNGERSCSTKTNRGCRSTTRFNFNFSIQLDRHCSSLIRRKGDTNTTEALKKLALHVVGIHDRRDVLTKIVVVIHDRRDACVLRPAVSEEQTTQTKKTHLHVLCRSSIPGCRRRDAKLP